MGRGIGRGKRRKGGLREGLVGRSGNWKDRKFLESWGGGTDGKSRKRRGGESRLGVPWTERNLKGWGELKGARQVNNKMGREGCRVKSFSS